MQKVEPGDGRYIKWYWPTRPGCDCPEIMRIVREGFIKGHGVTVQQSALTSPKEEIRQ
jgi:hypothetical protein